MTPAPAPADPHAAVDEHASAPAPSRPKPAGAGALAGDRSQQSKSTVLTRSTRCPPDQMVNIRNDMYLVSEGLRLLAKSQSIAVSDADQATLGELQDAARQRDQVHSDLGQGRGGDRPGSRDDDRLEAHRRHGRRDASARRT